MQWKGVSISKAEIFGYFLAALQGPPILKRLSFPKFHRKYEIGKNLMCPSAPSLIPICSAITLFKWKRINGEAVLGCMFQRTTAGKERHRPAEWAGLRLRVVAAFCSNLGARMINLYEQMIPMLTWFGRQKLSSLVGFWKGTESLSKAYKNAILASGWQEQGTFVQDAME